MGIHETAYVDPKAKIGKDVFIGPGAVVLGDTTIGDGCYLHNHATVGSNECTTVFGKRNVVFPGAVVGGIPQDLKYADENTKLIVGDDNKFRECVTVNTGTVSGGSLTQIGDRNLIMAYCHIAHDCILGNDIVVANSTNFAGHVIVEDHVKIGGVCSFNQFVNVGAYSYIAGESSINKDIIPYTIARGNYAVSTVTNKIGLERAGFSKEDIAGVHRAIRSVLKGSETIEKSIETILEQVEGAPNQLVDHLIKFIQKSERGVAR
jgi:UDP-N-acetylglucosamine acyltransferase